MLAPGFPLNFPSTLGDKISLWGQSGNHYGLGVQGGLLQIHSDLASAAVAFGYGQSSSFTETMRIQGNGKVGIGTSTPQRLLTVNGSTASPGSDSTYQAGIGTGSKQLILGYDTTDDVGVIAASDYTTAWKNISIAPAGGSVGIGTTTPTKGSLEIDSANGSQPGYNPAGWLQTSGAHGSYVTSGGDVSIWAAGFIFADTFIAFSDERIKNIKGQSDSAADLKTLLGIKITDYTYKDTIAKGNRPQKKVIAQQVEQVYPQAVTMSTDVVPDIYRNAALKDGWVQLATDLKVGDRVKLIGEKQKGIYAVVEVREGAFRTDFKPVSDKVFVYGREVKDFRTVDYEAISMLNVSATQELAKRLEKLESCESHIADLEQKSARVATLEQEVADLKKMVEQLAAVSKHTKLTAETPSPSWPTSAKASTSELITTASLDH